MDPVKNYILKADREARQAQARARDDRSRAVRTQARDRRAI
jgi:hypothetical protein